MPNQTTIGPAELLRVFFRHAVLALGVAAAISIASAIVILKLPDEYESRSVVYIAPARLPESYKKPGQLMPKLAQLVGVLRQEVLSREALRDIVNDLNLYEVKATAPGEEAQARPRGWLERLFFVDPIERAKKDIRIDLVRRGTDDFVEIVVRARTADLAARAVNRVADSLAAKSQAQRVKQEREARDFIEARLAVAQRRLQDAEANLARFRETHQENLPENTARLSERLEKVKAEIAERKERIARSQSVIAELNSEIALLLAGAFRGDASGERKALESDIRAIENEIARLVADGKGEGWIPLRKARAALAKKRRELESLDAAPPLAIAPPEPAARPEDSPKDEGAKPGGAGSPGGIEAERVFAELGRAHAVPEVVEQAQRLVARIAAETSAVESLRREIDQSLRELARLDALAASAAAVRSQLTEIQGRFDEASSEQRGLLRDLHDVEKLIQTEEAGHTDQFQTIEAAEAPILPAAPNRPLLMAAAFLAALGAGYAAAYLVEMAQRSYHDRASVEEDLGTVVLAILPLVPEPRDIERVVGPSAAAKHAASAKEAAP